MVQNVILVSSDVGASAIAGLLVFGVISFILWVKNKDNRVLEGDVKKVQQLDDLKKQGLLTENEYDAKIDRMTDEKLKREVVNTSEYNSLKQLKKQGLLTEQEFESKVAIIIEKAKIRFQKMK